MSKLPSEMDEPIKFCEALMSCSDCQGMDQVVLSMSCSHLICNDCKRSHSCLQSGSGKEHLFAPLPPSVEFLKEICQQLTKISLSQRRCETVERLETMRERHLLSRKKTKSSSPKKNISPEKKTRKFSNANGVISDGLSPSNCKKINVAQIDDIVTRYLSVKDQSALDEPNPSDISQDEMPHLTRMDFGGEVSRLPSASNSDVHSKPHDLVAFGAVNNNINASPSGTSNKTNNNSNEPLSWNAYSMRNSFKSFKKKTPKNVKRKKIKGIYLLDLKNIALNGSCEELDFRGFRSFEIDSVFVKILRRKMVLSGSSSATLNAFGLHMSIKDLTDTSHSNPPSTPFSGRIISPVTSAERQNANASAVLENSQIDFRAINFSTPEIKPYRSKRQLSFLSPNCETGDVELSPIPEEDDVDMPHISPCSRTKKRSTDESFSDIDLIASPPLTNGHVSIKNEKIIDETGSEEKMHNILNKLIYKENKEKSHADGNESMVVSFATCGLSAKQQTNVAKLARLTKSRLTNSFCHETTHLIMNENAIDSQEYLFAIVYKAIIVTYDWVTLCLGEEKILSPMGFTPKVEEGPCRCLEVDKEPFEGLYFFMGIAPQPSHLDYASYQVTKTLCSHGGGKIILDHEGFSPLIEFEFINPRFFVSVSSELSDLDKEACSKLRALPIKHTWISDSIRQYRALPINNYLYCSINFNELISSYKFPQELFSLSS